MMTLIGICGVLWATVCGILIGDSGHPGERDSAGGIALIGPALVIAAINA